jgi:hypothetical protein
MSKEAHALTAVVMVAAKVKKNVFATETVEAAELANSTATWPITNPNSPL